MEDKPDEMEMEMEDEPDEMMDEVTQALSEIPELEIYRSEIVQEVAKRVAKDSCTKNIDKQIVDRLKRKTLVE